MKRNLEILSDQIDTVSVTLQKVEGDIDTVLGKLHHLNCRIENCEEKHDLVVGKLEVDER